MTLPPLTNLEALTHPALRPLTHGFFTRKGGASSGLFAGLNCGRWSSDQQEMVTINRARVAAELAAQGTSDDAAASRARLEADDLRPM